MGELAALGPPGRARGVDDGGQVGRLGRAGALGDDLVLDSGAGLGQRGQRRFGARLDPPDSMTCSKAAVSAKQARAPESDKIHSACSAEDVS